MKKLISAVSLSLILGLSLAPFSAFAQGPLNLSQTYLSMSPGQTLTVTAYPNPGQIANISAIDNASVVSATAANNLITIYALTNGTAQVTLCTYDNSCGYISVSVGGYNNNGYNYNTPGQISFSQTNVSLTNGQSMNISIYGNSYSNNYYISSNSNSSSVQASIVGTTLYLYGLTSGSATISVCQTGYSCGTVFATVTGYNNNNYNNGTISFSQTNVSLTNGQSMNVSIYGANYGTGFYISTNSDPSIASASIVGSTLYLDALTNGSTTISVCQTGNYGCGSVYVSVSGYNYNYNNNYGTITFSPNPVSLNLYQTVAVNISGTTNNVYPFVANFYVSNNTSPSVVTASISGQTLTLYGSAVGSSYVTVCQTGSICGTVTVTVNSGYSNYNNYNYNGNYNYNSGTLYFLSPTLPQPVINQAYSDQLAVAGGATPYSFMVTSGTLPTGMYMSNQGLISGTPVSTGTWNFTIQATDYYGRTAVQNMTLTPTNSGLAYNYNYNTGTGAVLGASIYQNGTLINDNGTIYITYKNTKSGFSNLAAFAGLGYRMSTVISGSTAGLTDSGFVISNSAQAHPWGSWIQNGGTIYFVHDQGLIPIASYDVFLNNGGNQNLVVPANQSDFGKPLEGVMGLNDSRLR